MGEHLALAGIAGLASLIGVAELTGAFSTGLFTDRLGKRRAVSIGLVINAAGYAVMGLSGDSVVLGVGGALVAFLGFEFLIVSSFPLASELVPGGRGRYLAWLVVAISLGRSVAGAIGPALFTSIGFGANATAAVVLGALATFCVVPPNAGGSPSGQACDSHDDCASGWCYRRICYEACADASQCTNTLHECALLDVTVDGVSDNSHIRGCVPPAN